MDIPTLVRALEQPQLAADELRTWGLRDSEYGQQILVDLANLGLPLDLLGSVCRQLKLFLPATSAPDAALHNFYRYITAVRSPLSLTALLERDAEAMPMLLSALAIGPRFSDMLVADPEAFDWLRQAGSGPISRETITSDAQSEVAALGDDNTIIESLIRIRQRHLLRIAYHELAGTFSIETTMGQLTVLTEALVEAALFAALTKTALAKPLTENLAARLHICVLGIGDLGAGQCHYTPEYELLVVFDAPTRDAAELQAVHEHSDRTARWLERFLTATHAGEPNYRGELLSLPDSNSSAAAHAAEDLVFGLDSFGRTWHRRQMLEARPIAGDRALGERVLTRLTPWLFRRYLHPADETGIQALKRRILVSATLRQDKWRSARLGRGGIQDIEATVELLQLVAGGDHAGVRVRGTLSALAALADADIISRRDCDELIQNYCFFRRLEHRQQTVLSTVDSELPEVVTLVEHVAATLDLSRDAAALEAQLKQRLTNCWSTVRQLLSNVFPEEAPVTREVDLLLDPAPPVEEVRAALAPFGFAEPQQALATLDDLSREQVPFLSTRRCRRLLADILPRLLAAVSRTPSPDRTLSNLARVSNSLGGKAVLWDLFRAAPATLELYVKLCAASPYLSDILTTNPGMIDELVDSLQLDRLPSHGELEATLAELCRGAGDTSPILHDFKAAMHLRIGVRDILGREDIDRAHAALADVAEVCLHHVAELEFQQLVEKHGTPRIGLGPLAGEPARLVIVGLGKLGGREPNYHSHVEVLFLYEAEGTSQPRRSSRRVEQTANSHFFSQLAQRIGKRFSDLTPKGRLYTLDFPLRPLDIGGGLAMTWGDFAQHFSADTAPLWHWQALCQARPVFGDPTAQSTVEQLIRQQITQRPKCADDMAALRRQRLEQQRGASAMNLKRGPGGTLDVEYLVQWLQLLNAPARPGVLSTNTQDAIGLLAEQGVLSSTTAEQLGDAYRFLRRVESGLRLLNTSARHDLPTDSQQLAQLALLLGHSNPERLRDQCLQFMLDNRALFDQLTVGQ